MKGYGLPRDYCIMWPDRWDAAKFGLKTSATGSDMKNKRKKAAARRIWKRCARRAGKKACQEV